MERNYLFLFICLFIIESSKDIIGSSKVLLDKLGFKYDQGGGSLNLDNKDGLVDLPHPDDLFN